MSQAEHRPTPACPSAKAARTLINAIQALARAEAPERGPVDLELAALIDDRLEHAIEAASWARPATSDGALMHVILACADAVILPEATAEAGPGLVRRVERNLYAAAHYLLGAADIEDPQGWEALFAFAMPHRNDRAGDALDLIGDAA